MDEALAFCALDISGRPFLVFDCAYRNPSVGAFDCCMTGEFFRAFAQNAGITLHLRVPYGETTTTRSRPSSRRPRTRFASRFPPRAKGRSPPKGCSDMIAIIDYGAGNLFSVQNALTYLNETFCITRDPAMLEGCDGMILPGVGAFPDAMKRLRASGLGPGDPGRGAKKAAARHLPWDADALREQL